MSHAVHEQVVIAASPERVWETIMDPTLLGRWVSTHASVEGAEGGPVGEGAAFKQRVRVAGRSFRVEWRVVEADRPHLACWEGRGPAGSTAHVRYRLDEEDGATRFSYENEFEPPGGALGRAAAGRLIAAAGKREARKSLAKLRTLLEGDGQPS